jgi:hypothetical protein
MNLQMSRLFHPITIGVWHNSEMYRTADPRPSICQPLQELLADVKLHSPALASIEINQILIVALSARGSASASVRTFQNCGKEVRIDGTLRIWELGLRPIFFRSGEASQRLTTLIHELLHLSNTDPSGLHPPHRHQNCSQSELDAKAGQISEAWIESGNLDLIAPLAHHGEILMRKWLTRPHETTSDRTFNDDDLFLEPLTMITPTDKRSVWWSS